MSDVPVYDILKAWAPLRTLLGGGNKLPIFEAEALQTIKAPYIVWTINAGTPENYLGNKSDVDSVSTQFEVYATTMEDVKNLKKAIRDAVDGKAYVTAMLGEVRDTETRAFVSTFDVDWIIDRP